MKTIIKFLTAPFRLLKEDIAAAKTEEQVFNAWMMFWVWAAVHYAIPAVIITFLITCFIETILFISAVAIITFLILGVPHILWRLKNEKVKKD